MRRSKYNNLESIGLDCMLSNVADIKNAYFLSNHNLLAMQDPASVERLQRGDVATLKRLYKTNHSKLFPMAFRLTQDREAASHVISDAFRQLWEERTALDVFDPLDMTLVRHTYAHSMVYRAENGIEGYSVMPDRLMSPGAEVPEIENIEEEDRLTYLLFVVDGYSFRELARAYDVSIEDVQLSMGRAMVALGRVRTEQAH